jgi:two-component system chemotaxis response regulator CheB
VIGVLLSGLLYDGTAGLLAVKMHGGMTIVQYPEEAAYPELCRTAIKYVEVDHTLRLSHIAALLPRLIAPLTPKEFTGR